MKLQWLKFDINFFDDEKIKVILDKPSGDAIILIWVRMLCLAMKSARPGLIEIRDGVPYDLDELAAAFGVKESILRTALQVFHRMGMIEVSEGSPIEIVNFLSWQNVEGIERQRELTRERVRKYREKLIGNGVGNALPLRNVTPCNDDRLDQIRSDQKREDKTKEKKNKNKDVVPTGTSSETHLHDTPSWQACDFIYQLRKARGTQTMPKGLAKNFWKDGEEFMREVLKTDTLDQVKAVYTWASKDPEFWSGVAWTPQQYPKIKAAFGKKGATRAAELEYYEKILRGEA